MNREAVSPALGKITSGIYIATSILDHKPVGMLASFIEQAGFAPPFVTIAVQPGRLLDQALEAGGSLGVNVLGESGGSPVMKPFVQGDNDSPFDDLEFELHDGKAPRLSGALAFLLCEPKGSLATGDHKVFACEVVDGIQLDDTDKPMVRIRKNGFGY